MNHQLVLGCGYLGQRLFLRLRASGAEATITNRSGEVPAALSGERVECFAIHCSEPNTWHSLDVFQNEELDIYCLFPPSQVDTEKFREFTGYLADLRPRRLIMSSSTVVYPAQGETVDADSEVAPDGARAERQFRLESIVRSINAEVKIVRLAGLYGPGRVIGQKSIMNGELIRGSGDSWLNLVHVDDAAELLLKVMTSDRAADVELGSDGRPLKRYEYYQELANALARPAPVFEESEKSTAGGRRCDNTLTCQRTGWTSHHKGAAIRGPKKTSIVKKQHTAKSPL